MSVWIGISGSGHIIGPFFYGGNLNLNAYLQVLNEEIIPRLFELFRDRVDHLWWIIGYERCLETESLHLDMQCMKWPPRSPDLTTCDFFVGLFEKQSL